MDSTSRSGRTPSGRLFIVRHGESGWNRMDLVQGQSPAAPGLTGQGREHAAAAASRLAGSGATVILTSDLRRARETALPIAAALGVPTRLEPRLRERDLGAAQGRPAADVTPAETGFADERVTDPDARPSGGESIRELYRRVTDLLGELAASVPDGRIVLVTHGGPVRVARAYLAGLGPAAMGWPPVLNGSVLEVACADLTGRRAG
jgi:2,3-bisphosphoglycerate-dependent phosphoglycerate mutase